MLCVAVCCSVLQCVPDGSGGRDNANTCVAVSCCVLQCDAVWCGVVQCDAVCGGVWQCVAMCCSVFVMGLEAELNANTRVTVCCSVLQCGGVVCCMVLQCVAVCCI